MTTATIKVEPITLPVSMMIASTKSLHGLWAEMRVSDPMRPAVHALIDALEDRIIATPPQSQADRIEKSKLVNDWLEDDGFIPTPTPMKTVGSVPTFTFKSAAKELGFSSSYQMRDALRLNGICRAPGCTPKMKYIERGFFLGVQIGENTTYRITASGVRWIQRRLQGMTPS